MLWLGSRSYGIYLFHLPVYLSTREIWFRLSPENTKFGNEYFVEFVITAAILDDIPKHEIAASIQIPTGERGRRG